MSESSTVTTVNGFEIEHQRNILTFAELQEMTSGYGITGANPIERLRSLKQMSEEGVALFLTDMNRRLQGSDGSLVHNGTMKVGETPTIAPEDRYSIFSSIIDQIRRMPSDTNPARVGDTLALTTILLHPFKDGNGRTARMLGLIFRDNYDDPDASEVFAKLAASREQIRATGADTVISYAPELPKEAQSDPTAVGQYLSTLLTEEYPGYVALGYDYAPLKLPAVPEQEPSIT